MVNSSINTLTRRHPLENHLFAANGVLVKPAQARSRIILRASADQVGSINEILGIDLPVVPKSANSKTQRVAMWLGPDEWLIYDNPGSGLLKLPIALADIECSLVDVSHRNTAILLSGKGVENVLNTGCPQNLSLEEFPVEACTRTVLGKSEIILLRASANTFHIECWRSFADYVWKYLVDGVKTL